MKSLLTLLIFLIAVQSFLGQTNDYQSVLIDEKYKKNANSFIRLYSTHIKIEEQDKMLITHKQIITVLNKNGDKDIDAYLYYDDNINVKKLEATVYDALGNEIDTYKKRDFRDVSAVDGGTLYNDSRIYFFDYTPLDYPYTVEFSYEIKNSNTAFVRPWRPLRNYYQSVKLSEFSIENYSDSDLRFSQENLKFFKNVTILNSGQKVSCKAKDIPALKYESYSPSMSSFLPKVNFALTEFTLEGQKGKASDWQEMGEWQYENLIKGRDEVSEKTKQEILSLTKGIDDPLEKAKIVYKYVQDRTRYISVQVGIGGWQPIDAKTVDKVKYGDCKGLTNYTKALLKIAGIDAKYTVVYAGSEKRDIDEDFASMQGNHVILNLPLEEKDFWLECTSQDIPFGFLGTFTDDRKVLVIDETGGKIKTTDAYYAKENYQKTDANISIAENGNLNLDIDILSKGTQFNNKYSLDEKSKKQIVDTYKSYYGYLKNINIKAFDFKSLKGKVEFVEHLEVSTKDYCSTFGNRIMFRPNVLNRTISVPDKFQNRMTPFVISRGFYDEDYIVYTLPQGSRVESLPKPVNITSKFGDYSTKTYQNEKGKIVYERKMLLKNGEFTNQEYKAFRDFMKAVNRADNAKVILIKKT